MLLKKQGIQFILNKHENNGGHMAEGIYQRTGAIGALVATIGPGATNIINVVANAHQERVPLLVITGCVDIDVESNYTHQILDHQAVFAEVTKASFKLSAKTADTIIDKAIAIALDGQPGPVHIDVPIGVADTQIQASLVTRPARPSISCPAPGKDLDQAKLLLQQAKNPLLIAGVDVLNQQGEAAVQTFVKKYQMPIITTYKGKGIVSEDDPLSLGGAGLSPLADSILLELVEQADLIIGAGYDPIEMRDGWRNVWDPIDTPMIDFTAVSNHHYMHSNSFSFVGNVAAGLNVLAEGISSQAVWENNAIKGIKERLKQSFLPGSEWGPDVIISTVRELMPKDTIATCDTGAHRILQSQMWTCYESKTLLQSSALCTMACAMPLAAGAKIANPERPVVAFTGDGGMLMMLGDLVTVAELQLPIIIIVFVDSSIALIEKKQR